jgi:hypothetical protein
MRVEHLAVDGSIIAVEAQTDLSSGATATGWAIVPSLMRAHPFTICPAGHSQAIADHALAAFPSMKVVSTTDYSLKGGSLRVAEVEFPTATGGVRTLTIGAWEGRGGCLTTSLVGSGVDRLIEVFDTLHFRERARGLAIDSPVTPRPRVPEVIKEVPGIGILNIQPALPSVLERIPRARGKATNHGELFRIRATSRALTYVSNSAVVNIDPFEEAESPTMMAMAQELRVEWMPARGIR